MGFTRKLPLEGIHSPIPPLEGGQGDVYKEKNNSFDGIVNFATQENGKVLFIGNLDLLINNVFNKGEEFNINWNS